MTPPHAGKGLLMVESDQHALRAGHRRRRPGSTFEIPVTKDWERHDVYVTALVFRGGSAPSKITPARAVGVAHVPMDRARSHASRSAWRCPRQMRPEQRAAGDGQRAAAGGAGGVRHGVGGRRRHPQHHPLPGAGRRRAFLRAAPPGRGCLRRLRPRDRKLRRRHREDPLRRRHGAGARCRRRGGRPRACRRSTCSPAR